MNTSIVRIMSLEKAKEIVALWEKHNRSTIKASRATGIPERTLRNQLSKAKAITGAGTRIGEVKELAPAAVPDGFVPTKTTVQYDADGNVIQEWRRLSPVAEALESVANRLCEQVDGKCPKLPKIPTPKSSDLMLEIPIYDPHFGKYAWSEETGQDYNARMTRDLVIGTVAKILSQSGTVGTGLLVIGGDWLHSDNRHGITERGGNVLDMDTRQEKVWQEMTDAIHESVSLMASACSKVKVVIVPGNHDWESMFHLGRVLRAYYRKEARIEIIAGPKSRHYIQHGKVLIGVAHGHLMKMNDFPTLMAHEVPEMWAATKERVWHLGHWHTSKVMHTVGTLSKHGCTMEHLESISAADAWHHENGYIGSPRRVQAFLWHAQHGLRQRIYCTVDELSK